MIPGSPAGPVEKNNDTGQPSPAKHTILVRISWTLRFPFARKPQKIKSQPWSKNKSRPQAWCQPKKIMIPAAQLARPEKNNDTGPGWWPTMPSAVSLFIFRRKIMPTLYFVGTGCPGAAHLPLHGLSSIYEGIHSILADLLAVRHTEHQKSLCNV